MSRPPGQESESPEQTELVARNWIDRIIRFCLTRPVIILLLAILAVVWGLMVAPFNWSLGGFPRSPIPSDAIPDIGENQQIVFTEWMGRSPRDVEDQVTYPLAVALMGVPNAKTVRCFSMFGFSTVYIIFDENVDFYWSRSRVLEKLNSLPPNALPAGVKPTLGPDATELGQVFWYTLEGRDEQGRPTGGWDLQELRSLQDWYVRYALLSADGVSEVGSIGGYVQEYQVDVDPDLMRAYDIGLMDVVQAVQKSNQDVSANTVEMNQVEYMIRGVAFVKSLQDLNETVITLNNGVPVLLSNVAQVTLGPAVRRGALDKGGAEVVGGVVVARYGQNPLQTIKNIRAKIDEISPGLPQKTLADGRISKLQIVPFYDRSGLIVETLNTLQDAIGLEILVTILVVIVMLLHLSSSLLIAGLLPLAVLTAFVAMKVFGVDANIVALSGIAIAIGTMVDMGIIIIENVTRHLEHATPNRNLLSVIFGAASEVGSSVVTAAATTIVSFLPVFTMEAAEGKLFRPLAFTKTFALVASILVALTIIPPLAYLLRSNLMNRWKKAWLFYEGIMYLGLVLAIWVSTTLGVIVAAVGAFYLIKPKLPPGFGPWVPLVTSILATAAVVLLLGKAWMPLGLGEGFRRNLIFIVLLLGAILTLFQLFHYFYTRILGWCLNHKKAFLSAPVAMLLLGALIWLGFNGLFGWLPNSIRSNPYVSKVSHALPGLKKEFMPPLDEGSYLYMPVTLPHASIGEVMDVLRKQDIRIQAIPEVECVVGKLGRADSPLDPAPVSMIETVVNFVPEYLRDDAGRIGTYQYDPEQVDLFRKPDGALAYAADGFPYVVPGRFIRDKEARLIPDPSGRPFRLWRPALLPDLNPGRAAWTGIRRPDDIWIAVSEAGRLPGVTAAPRLQPISARIVMLQSGISASMGVKVSGPDLETIQEVGFQIEKLLRQVPAIDPQTVIAERIIGKPYLEIHIDRKAAAQYGVSIQDIQDVIETAIGGKKATTTVEGRERYPVRIRYLRELRDRIDLLGEVVVPTPIGAQIPLKQLTKIEYVRGPQMIKNEDTFLTGYVLFEKKPEYSEVEAVDQARTYLTYEIERGEFVIPAGVSHTFVGSFENQVRAQKKLMVILPLSLFVILIILYLHFNNLITASLVFTSIGVAWASGFIMLWLYGQSWFLDFTILGNNMRDLFQVHPINLSVAVWVGFLALFGIASDDGVIMATYLDDTFAAKRPDTVQAVREATIEAGGRRVRPCLMTTATTVLALLPVLTSTGRGSDIMVPMAIPSFGGMVFGVITILVVPVLYCALQERKILKKEAEKHLMSSV
ncbi:MAG: efflux RND transporter permease subunit [Deltaproteobacteria bacterium]|nr:efflux RND transporter permease subunit [Deltaproteobacteria bacterium]